MSPVATAPVEAPPAPPPRPGYLSVVWATFLGYLWTLILGVPLVVAASLAGLDVVDRSGSVGRGLFYRYDAWSWAAEACVGLIAVGATALMVGQQLRIRTGWEVRFSETFLILLVAGYAPLLALTPLYGATAIVSLGVAAFLLGSFPDRITLELRQGASCPALRATLDAVWIRYTVLGMRHEQRIPLVDGPSVRCR
jgi:hypothetical protein